MDVDPHNSYQFRRLHEGDLEGLADLYARCFPEPMPLTTLRNKFATPMRQKFVAYVATTEAGSIVASYGVYPVAMRIAGREVVGAQSGDTMTHPEHTKRGLFVRLAKLTYELAAEEGVALVFGFPNENSYPGFVKRLGWSFQDYMISLRFEPRSSGGPRNRTLQPARGSTGCAVGASP